MSSGKKPWKTYLLKTSTKLAQEGLKFIKKEKNFSRKKQAKQPSIGIPEKLNERFFGRLRKEDPQPFIQALFDEAYSIIAKLFTK